MDLSVILHIYQDSIDISSLITSLINQFGNNDNLIIINSNKNNYYRRFLPNSNKIIYIENFTNNIKTVINQCIIQFCNEYIIFLDPQFKIDSEYLKNIRRELKNNNIIFGNINHIELPSGKITPDNRISVLDNYCLFNSVISKEMLINLNLLNENKNLNLVNTRYQLVDKILKTYKFLRSNNVCVTRKGHRKEKYDEEIIDNLNDYSKKLFKNCSIIIPNNNCVQLIKYIQSINYKNDELISFVPGSITYIKDFINQVKNAKFNNILYISRSSPILNCNILDIVKLYNYDNIIVLDPKKSLESNIYVYESNFNLIKDDSSVFCTKEDIINNFYKDKIYTSIPDFMKSIVCKSKKSVYGITVPLKESKKNPQKISFIPFTQIENKKLESAVTTKIITRNSNSKPHILLIADVEGWAWWNKSLIIKKYLSDKFNFDIIANPNSTIIDPKKYDLYVTYGYDFVHHIMHVDKSKRISGTTAHRPISCMMPYLGSVIASHANSILLYDNLNKYLKDVYYTPNGIEPEIFMKAKKIPEKRDNIICIHVGKKSTLKGQQDFIIPSIKKSRAESMLHLNNHNNKIPLSEMYKIYEKGDVFLIASMEDGTPNPGLEAACCGRPIISNRIGNMPELIEKSESGQCGFIVDKKIDSYVEKIVWYQNNRDKLIEHGLNAQKEVLRNWTWEKNVNYYAKMFCDVLSLKFECKYNLWEPTSEVL